MCKRLSEKVTKTDYARFLDETIDIFCRMAMNPDDELSRVILAQLSDIRENVVRLGVLTEWDEINERYTLGGLAVNNFDGNEELEQRLLDVFLGAIRYYEMKN